MKKTLSLVLSLMMILTTFTALPFTALAANKVLPSDITFDITTNFQDGGATTGTDALNAITNKISNSSYQIYDQTIAIYENDSTATTAFDKNKPTYRMLYAFGVKTNNDNYFFTENGIKGKIKVNGVTATDGEVKVISDPVTINYSPAYRKVQVTLYFYNVSYADGTCLGFYNRGTKVAVNAPAAPEGKYFSGWTGRCGMSGTSSIVFDNATSANTNMTVGSLKNTVTPNYADYLIANIDGNFAVGSKPSAADLTVTTAEGYKIENFSVSYKDSNGNFSTYKLADDVPYYTMTYTFAFSKNDVMQALTKDKVNIKINGVKLHPSYISTTDNYTVKANVTYNNVTIQDNGCLGFFNYGYPLNITAPAAPTGQHFVSWRGTSYPNSVLNFDDKTSMSTSFTVGSQMNTLIPAYATHDFGANEKTCTVCGAANPNYQEPPVVLQPKENPQGTTTQENPQTQTTSPATAKKVKLSLKKVAVKKNAKKLVLQATLKIDGKAVKGKKITFKFNGKKYTAKTNKKGVAKVTVKKSVLKKLKKGKKITYSAKYGKKTVKKTVKVK